MDLSVARYGHVVDLVMLYAYLNLSMLVCQGIQTFMSGTISLLEIIKFPTILSQRKITVENLPLFQHYFIFPTVFPLFYL